MSRALQARTRRVRRHARSVTRRRVVAAIGTLAVLGTAGASWFANSSSATPPPPAAAPFVAPAVGNSNYPIPAGAIFVAPSSATSARAASSATAGANGSAQAPYTSIAQAAQHAKTGGTIVVRGGTYHETLGTISRRVNIQAYPHESVWIDGAVPLGAMARVGNAWVETHWNPHVCHNCYPKGALERDFPFAGSGDQVYIDDVPQRQVGSLREIAPGRFYVDHRAGRLYVGSNPNGHRIEATAYEKALQLGGGATGSSVRGIGFEHFAPHYNMDVPAMVVVDAANVTFDDDTFALSAGRGLSVFRPGAVITHSMFLDNGINAFHANTADGLEFENNLVVGSNFSHWSIAPTGSASIAGAKITSTSNGVIKNNVFAVNNSNGVWLDVSSSHFTIANNDVVGNAGMGIAVELSGYVIVAGNVSSGNARIGIKVSGSNNVSLWDNTVANNGWAQIGVYQDPRSTAHPRDGATWNTSQVTIANNVIIGRTGATKSVLDSFNGRRGAAITTARMVSFDDRNVWGRPVPSSPRFMASWQDSGRKAAYATLTAIQQGTGRERHSVSADTDTLSSMFLNVNNGDYRLTNRNTAMVAGTAIPPSIAAAMGVRAGAPPHLGALNVPPI